MNNVLVIGACGLIGKELTKALLLDSDNKNIFTIDVAENDKSTFELPNYFKIDITKKDRLKNFIKQNNINEIYLLAAGHQNQNVTTREWKFNVNTLIAVLEISVQLNISKLFWPSSNGVFGAAAPKHLCPQECQWDPKSIDGISKKVGENWCQHYFENYGLDVRSLRIPNMISTSQVINDVQEDFVSACIGEAVASGYYTSYLSEDQCFATVYLPDLIGAIINLMNAPGEKISIRTSYNINGLSLAPCDLARQIQLYLPHFRMIYKPDSRNEIVRQQPASFVDYPAKADWGWQCKHSLSATVKDLLAKIAEIKNIELPLIPVQLSYPDFPMDDYVLQHY
jgi:nucleoside-diphosphate-sugar epimerase